MASTAPPLCRRFGISRKTGYKWIERYEREGLAGLSDRPRRPHLCPHQTAPCIVDAILKARSRHPSWGAKKLLVILENKHPSWSWPARSTVCDILKRHDLVPKKRRRRPLGHPGRPTTPMTEPNEIWTADFKGEFRTLDGIYCYPLTVADGFSRFLLECHGLLSTEHKGAMSVATVNEG